MFKYSEKRKRNVARVLCLVVAVAMIVSTGFYLILLFGGESAAVSFAVYAADSAPDSDQQLDRLSELKKMIRYIHENYKDPVTYEDLVNSAFRGVLDGLEDPWSVYYESAKESAGFVESIENEYVGVGITMTSDNNGCYISEVNRSGPAYEAGVRPGCYLTAVDGVSVSSMKLTQISSLVKGPAGTQVVLTILQNGVSRNVTVTRARIKLATVTGEMLPGNIGYLVVSSFASDTASDFSKMRRELAGQGAKGLIIDIRDNGGGYVNTAFDMADELMDSGTISIFRWRDEELERIFAEPDDIPDLPVVLLINENTASAAEIFAAALKDNGRAVLVGKTTYGKGVAQLILDIGNGDSFKLSEYYFVSPNGNVIDHVGIAPDYYVENGNLSEAEIALVKQSIVPMNEGKKYSAGSYGLTVLGAQQRLSLLGYDVDINGYMDAKTVAAIRAFQPLFGGTPYGGLDLSTQRELEKAYNEYLTPASEDLLLKKALELLTK